MVYPVSFCNDKFWNLNTTWYTEIPDFTNCFQQSVFVFIPCLLFCLIGLPYFACSCRNQIRHSLPWTALLIMKLILCFFLIAINICKLIYDVYVSNDTGSITMYGCGIQIMTFFLIILILLQHRTNGVKISSLLFTFWSVFSIFGTVIFRSIFLKVFIWESPSISYGEFILSVIYYTMVYCQLFLSFFVDAKYYVIAEKQSPIEEVPSFLYLSHFWMTGIIFRSLKKLLTLADFDPLSPLLKARNQFRKLEAEWMKKLLIQITEDTAVEIRQPSSCNLVNAFIKAFRPWAVYSIIFELIGVVTRLLPALILDIIIEFIGSKDYVWKGYLYCCAIFFVALLNRFMQVGAQVYPTLVALQVKNALRSAIYRKALKISSSARRNYTCGELINLIAVDVDKIFEMVVFSTLFFALPLRIILSLVVLWQYLGIACLAGVAVMVAIILLTLVIAKINNNMQVKQMVQKDVRMKNMSEILNGIKVLKFWAWEDAFMKKIESVRLKEVRLIRNYLLCYAASSFFYGCTPFLVAIACFSTYLYMDRHNVLYPSTVFVSINLLNTLKYVLFELPNFMSKVVQAKVSLDRLNTYFSSEEFLPNLVGECPDEGEAVTVRDASFSWDLNEAAILKNMNLHVKTGKLVAIIGLVGSGKSSLLSAILGSMYKLCGSIDVEGKLAYVPQQAWIQNQTVRDNILLMKPMNKTFYDSILDSCCLRTDLELLAGNDMTEIGEKGVTISGGQKQRISLARAIYQDADVYLLDDPLSAVDAHVGKAIFENVIGRMGQLRKKTRILVTHNMSFLPDVDTIVCIKDGKIEETGTYESLMDHKGSFFQFIQKHVGTEELNNTENKGEKLLCTLPDVSCDLVRSASINRVPSIEILPSTSISSPYGTKLIEDEQMQIGEVKKILYWNYMKHAGVLTMIVAISGYLLFQVFEVAANVWLSEWSSDPAHAQDPVYVTQTSYRLVVYAAFGACQAVSTIFGAILIFLASARASRIYHGQMLDGIMKSPMSFFDTTPQGRILNRFGKDIDVIDVQVPLEFDGWLVCFFIVVGTVVVISMTTPWFLVALVPVTIAFYIIQKLYLKAARRMKRMESVRRSPIFSYFAETIQGLSSIKAFNIESRVIEEFESRADANTLCYYYWSSCNNWLTVQLDIISCLMLLIASMLAVYDRRLLGGAMVGLSLTYALSVTDALTWLVRTSVEIENQSVSVERIDEYSKLTPEAPWHISDHRPPENWPENGIVKFKDYSTRYREGLDLVLKEINLDISPGEKVGIVGRTGAGKSSITLALFRIIEPDGGELIIDEVDIMKIGLHDLRSKLTIIPQDPVLFSGSLRLNLDPKNVYSDDELWLSLEHAHMKTFVAATSSGLEYEFSEGGENLSVGQRQLICLARALLKKTRILILDEATAAVDLETDSLIQETIRTEFSHYTVITIAHRLNTIMDYDRVIVMDAGKIIEIGKPSELVDDSSSHFYEMACNANLI